MKHESPQMRRLKSDRLKLQALTEQSSVVRFRSQGDPPTRYIIEYHGRSLSREKGKVTFREHHEVEIKLGVSYPRAMPEIRWVTPIYHPNISEVGLVCLGGYGTHWVPSLHLDELCVMLWDMARYHNYDIRSPYNRDAALWAAHQTTFTFPIDSRTLRDKRESLGRLETEFELAASPAAVSDDPPIRLSESDVSATPVAPLRPPAPPPPRPVEEIVFLD